MKKPRGKKTRETIPLILLGKVNIFFFGTYPYSTAWDPELLIKTNVTEGVAENLVRK
jgi:hypothetical protein